MVFNPGFIFLPALTHLAVLAITASDPVFASFNYPSLDRLCLGAYIAGGTSKYKNDHLKPSVLRIERLAFTWTVLHDCLRELS